MTEASRSVGVLLAAGRGRRFGADKRLHAMADGAPMAVAAASQLLKVCAVVVAVVRPEDDELAARLQAVGCRICACPNADLGMGHSLAAGVTATPDAAGWLIALGDMPHIRPDSYRQVIAALHAGASIARPSYQGTPGHPVGFASAWFAQLSTLTGDAGAREIVRQAGKLCLSCPVNEPGVIADIDRPEDLQAQA